MRPLTPTLIIREAGEVHRGAQFPELGVLLPRHEQGLAIQILSGVGTPLPQQQLPL